MDKVTVMLTVYFDAPFWSGIVERTSREQMSVSRMVFGAEPKDYEVNQYLLRNYDRLRFSPTVETVERQVHKNPKKIQREVQKQLGQTGIGTKSQQALKLQQEQMKTERRISRRERQEQEKQRQFEMKQQKRKEKHKGH